LAPPFGSGLFKSEHNSISQKTGFVNGKMALKLKKPLNLAVLGVGISIL